MKAKLARSGAALAAATALFIGAAGFMHTSAAQPLLARLTGGKCPFGQSRATLAPAQREELRREGLGRLVQRDVPAPARPALGFELGRMQRRDVAQWAASNGVACVSEAQGAGLACADVPVTNGLQGSLTFRFDPSERLVSVLRMVRTREPTSAVALGRSEQSELRESMGEPTRATGELSVATLASGPLRQARAEHRYRDFSALVSVTNLGAEGYLVTEEAQLFD
jgi:hypothetical protein